MRRRNLVMLGVLGFLIACIPAVFQYSPGYMDASYYYLGGINLLEGKGFSENILWNYLDNPAGIPHPSHGYWLPLTSIVSWLGMIVFGFLPQFLASRLPFLLLAGCVPPLTAILAYRLSKERLVGWLAGGFAIFSGFYLPYLGIQDSFSINLVLGLLFFLLLLDLEEQEKSFHWKAALLLGLITGLMHLSRTEGVIWFGVLGIVLGLRYLKMRSKENLMTGLAAIGGYLLVMGPWMIRNLIVFGAPLSPGGASMLWLTDYNELFIYPASLLNPAHLLEMGWPAILQVRWDALVENIGSLIAVQSSIILFPFLLMGLWQLRKKNVVKASVLGFGNIMLMMSLFFPYAGFRGGFFHAGAVWQGLFWALAAIGFAKSMRFMDKFPKWEYMRALKRVGLIMITGLIAVSFAAFYQKVIVVDWDTDQAYFDEIDLALDNLDIESDELVIINNPPSFTAESGRASIVIPDGDVETLLAVSRRYNAKWLVLNEHYPEGLAEYYAEPENFESFTVHLKIDSTYIIEINE